MKKLISLVALVLLISSFSLATAVGSGGDCFSAADAAEMACCGSNGCSDTVWYATYDACLGQQQ